MFEIRLKPIMAQGMAIVFVSFGMAGGPAMAQGPSFACSKVEAGSTEEMICKDSGLSTLDRKLSEVYSAALKKAKNEHPPVLKAEQRGWIKGRNESLWEHHGEALVAWGYGAPEMRCRKLP